MRMMRRILAILMAAALLACGTVYAEEAAPVSPAEALLGEWVELDGFCSLLIEEVADGYTAHVQQDVENDDQLSYVVWAYGCAYDEETRGLKSFSRGIAEGDYDPEAPETITAIDLVYTGAAFCLDEMGQLVWSDGNETADDSMRFTRPIAEEEEPYDMSERVADFEGVWQCDRASIGMYWEDFAFQVLITWSSSAWEHTEWQYTGFYQPEDHTVVALPFGVRTDYVYDDHGTLVSAMDAYYDGEATFYLDEEGCLHWQDMKENAGEGMRFEKITETKASVFPFATIGEAMESEGYTGVAGSDEERCVVVVELDGEYVRQAADLDETARALNAAILENQDADALAAAFEAYTAYIQTLPIVYVETITDLPKDQAELDALAGKTLLEVEEAGYELSAYESGPNDEAFFTVSCGLFDYTLTLNETNTAYLAQEENGDIGSLTVQSVRFAGPSRNAVDPQYHPDAAIEAEQADSSEIFGTIMGKIADALISGKDLETLVRELTEELPDLAEEIRLFANIFSSMGGQNAE